jgi:flagellar basal-body rod modification protein FlgD
MTSISAAGVPGSAVGIGETPKPGGEMGKQEFLELLVTQLRHQDPLNPMDSTQFASQLAEFSSLEAMVNVSESVQAQSEAISMMALSTNTNLAASLLGNEVLAVGDQVQIGAGGSGAVTVDVGGGGGNAELRITNQYGYEMASLPLGTLGAGRHTLDIDDAGLPPGLYRYELNVTDADDAPVSVTQYVGGAVSGIQFVDGNLMLQVGEALVPMSYLVEVAPGEGAGSPGN